MIKRSHLSIFQFKSITHRLIFGCITTAIGIYGISYWHGRYLIQKNFGTWLLNLSQVIILNSAHEIDGKLLRIERDLLLLRQSIQDKSQNLYSSQTELSPQLIQLQLQLKQLLEQQPQIQAIALVNIPNSQSDISNRGWQYDHQGKYINLNDHESAVWLNRCQSDRANWTEPYFLNNTEKPRVSYCIPLVKNASVSSVIAIEVNLDWLRDFMQQKLANSEVNHFLELGDVFIAIPSHQPNQQWLVKPNNSEKIQSWLSQQQLLEGNRKLANTELVNTDRKVNSKTNFLSNYQDNLITQTVPLTGWIVGVEFEADRLEQASQQFVSLMIVSMARDVGLMCVVIALIMQITTRSLRDLNKSTEEMAKGNLDTILPTVTSEDEVGRLTQSFRRMRDSLQLYIHNLQETTAAKQKLESELSIAAQIQRTMLPRTNVEPNSPYDISAILKPARIVGGDLYDFFLMGSDRLCLIIGDVAGKGFPAALQMARTITLIRTLTKFSSTPSEILSTVNQELCVENEECQFVTVFCGVLELASGKFTYASSGHDAPILVRHRHVRFLELETSAPLGLYEDCIFTLQELTLLPNDLIIFYTDGITEAMNAAGEIFSETRLIEAIASHPPHNPARAVRTIQHFCDRFVAASPQSDDITLLAMQYLASNPFSQIANTMEWRLTVNSELTQLEEVKQKLAKILSAADLTVELIEDSQLIVEEVLVNIIQYGYDNRNDGFIDLRLEINDRIITITFEDSGKPFNPLTEAAIPDLDRDDEERSQGGFGFFLVQKLADQVTYAYRNDRNILTVSQKINDQMET